MKIRLIKNMLLWMAGTSLLAVAGQAFAVNCSGLAEWNSATAYTTDAQVKELGKAYKANWWTQNQSPPPIRRNIKNGPC